METEYLSLYSGGEAEVIEKKSRFISLVIPINSEDEVAGILERTKKKYWDARHHCYGFVCGDRSEIQRCGDDGEPSGTAGKPILDVIVGNKIHNILIIVVRYFGGTLLGTGGLVRAYSLAAKEGLKESKIITKQQGIKLQITTDYTGLGKIQYILAQRSISVLDTLYEADVSIIAMVPTLEKPQVIHELIEGTNGKCVLEELEICWYGNIDGRIEEF